MSNFISLNDAKALTYAYQNDSISDGQSTAVKFQAQDLNDILDQDDVTGVRFYFSLNSSDKLTLVVVGTNSNGDDLTEGYLLNRGDLCPPSCDTNSPLIDE